MAKRHNKRPDAAAMDDMFPETLSVERLYPVRRPKDDPAPMDFDAKLARAISAACKESSLTREDIAARMGVALGRPTFSKHMLDAYTCEANALGRAIPVRVLKAFIQITRATWIWDLVVEDDGCVVMEGEEARWAQRGLIRQQIEELRRAEKALASAPPVRMRRRRP